MAVQKVEANVNEVVAYKSHKLFGCYRTRNLHRKTNKLDSITSTEWGENRILRQKHENKSNEIEIREMGDADGGFLPRIMD